MPFKSSICCCGNHFVFKMLSNFLNRFSVNVAFLQNIMQSSDMYTNKKTQRCKYIPIPFLNGYVLDKLRDTVSQQQLF